MLEVKDLTVKYGSTVAVDSVSMDVAEGEIVALLGPSGSGKSSLLRAVLGLEPVAGGQVLWNGRDLSGVPTYQRGFGLMFQDGQLFAHRDVAGNIAYGLKGSGAQKQERVRELLDLVGLKDYASRQVSELSGGEAQRVALARSLAPRPKLLGLDEPLSALDRKLREGLAVQLRQILTAEGTAGIYVTHDQDEAFTVADKIGVLITGRLAAFGTPAQVWTQPGTRSVAEFLGYGPFVSPELAAKLGARVPRGAALIGLAPGALRVCFEGEGVHLPVDSVHVRRGSVNVQVILPDGQLAGASAPLTHEAGAISEGEQVGIRVDQTRLAAIE